MAHSAFKIIWELRTGVFLWHDQSIYHSVISGHTATGHFDSGGQKGIQLTFPIQVFLSRPDINAADWLIDW